MVAGLWNGIEICIIIDQRTLINKYNQEQIEEILSRQGCQMNRMYLVEN